MPETDDNPTVREYTTTQIKKLDKKDWDYLEKSYFRKKRQKFYDVYINRQGVQCIHNLSAAGLIRLIDRRLYFTTKVDTHLFYMLRSLKSEKDFLFDPNTFVEIESGNNFFDIIVRLFSKELKKIIKIGLLQKYVKKRENLDELKGDLDIEGQTQNDINDVFKFSCKYNDLTVDNMENRIILKTLDVLISLIRFDKNLKRELKIYEHLLKDSIKLVDLSSEDCDKISFDISNEHYISIIRLSKLILKRSFIKSVEEGKSIGFNFIVDMNIVFQNFITEMIIDVINNEPEFSKFETKYQKDFSGFIEGSNERPDIALKIKRKRLFPFPIELKYKIEKKVKKADHVQAAVYGTNLPGARLGCIICAKGKEDNIGKKSKQINKNMMKDECEKVPLLIYKIDLHIDDNLEYSEYIRNIKDQIKNIILDLMNISNITDESISEKEENTPKLAEIVQDKKESVDDLISLELQKDDNKIDIFAIYKNELYKAIYHIRQQTVVYKGHRYSPSGAAKEISKTVYNGWDFWKFKDINNMEHSLQKLRQ